MSNTHVIAGRIDGYEEWSEDTPEVIALSLQHRKLEEQISELRSRQYELSEQASELRLKRQGEIDASITEEQLDKLANVLLQVLIEHGPGWEGRFTQGAITVWCYDMHKLATRRDCMWCGWSVPWAHKEGGNFETGYPITAEQVTAACERVGLTVETWRSDAGVSCSVRGGWQS